MLRGHPRRISTSSLIMSSQVLRGAALSEQMDSGKRRGEKRHGGGSNDNGVRIRHSYLSDEELNGGTQDKEGCASACVPGRRDVMNGKCFSVDVGKRSRVRVEREGKSWSQVGRSENICATLAHFYIRLRLPCHSHRQHHEIKHDLGALPRHCAEWRTRRLHKACCLLLDLVLPFSILFMTAVLPLPILSIIYHSTLPSYSCHLLDLLALQYISLDSPPSNLSRLPSLTTEASAESRRFHRHLADSRESTKRRRSDHRVQRARSCLREHNQGSLSHLAGLACKRTPIHPDLGIAVILLVAEVEVGVAGSNTVTAALTTTTSSVVNASAPPPYLETFDETCATARD
ncbi:hypothetical protein D9619_011040 [Psilocybe cf. subviscida]|uniref:Uncharacterized protein n=1 Tax=Psilocybe cf. subviscida TaxID=2480587 RepID=A0A8H5EZX2_9AGAR|nr:hypothetical protein D9619_011040 [Psilocybe cf. subviscida]